MTDSVSEERGGGGHFRSLRYLYNGSFATLEIVLNRCVTLSRLITTQCRNKVAV